MSRVFRWGAVIALCAMMILPAWAQTEEPAEEQQEVVVVVTAERTAQPASESIASTTVVTAKQIKEQGAQTVADVMRMVPGVTLRQSGQTGSAVTAYVRGSKANQVLVLVDGQRMSSPAFFGGTDLSKFPLSEVARVEIVRGPVSSLYGSEAIGGVVNIITKKPSGGAGNAVYTLGNNGRSNPSLSLHGESSSMSWQLAGSAPQYSGARHNSDFWATDVSAGITLPSVRGWELSLKGEKYEDSLGLPGADPDRTGLYDPDDHQWWDRDRVALGARRDLGSGQIEWSAYHTRQRLRNLAPGAFGTYDTIITGVTDATEATYSFERGTHKFVVGGEYRNDDYHDVETGGTPLDLRESVDNLAMFAQDQWSAGPRTEVVLGMRFDDHSTAGSKATPRIGVNYALTAKTRLRASYSEGFRAPNFVELYYPPIFGPGYSGNPDLKPELSRQYEIGLSTQMGRSNLDFAVFSTAVRDMIYSDGATPYMNVGRARQRGIEISWDRKLSSSASLGVAYTYIDAENRSTGERLRGIPHNELSMTLAGMVQSWQVGLTGRWTDDRPDLVFNPVTYASSDVTTQGRAIFDLTLNKRGSGRSNPYVAVRNLFNVAHEEVAGFPTEGRSIEVGMQSAW